MYLHLAVCKKNSVNFSNANGDKYECTENECGEILEMGPDTLKKCVLAYSYPSWT